MSRRAYSQYCGLAHALDLAGDRWSLLIVRELLAGPRRYGDLADGLVTVPTNLLASRLRQMEEAGLVRRRRLDPPAESVSVYELTELGEDLGASVTELARWGMRTLPPTRKGLPFRAHWLVLALRARFDPAAAAGVTESYEFRVGADVIRFEVVDGKGSAHVGRAQNPRGGGDRRRGHVPRARRRRDRAGRGDRARRVARGRPGRDRAHGRDPPGAGPDGAGGVNSAGVRYRVQLHADLTILAKLSCALARARAVPVAA